MNFTLKLFPDEHKAFIEILLLKSRSTEFDRLTLGNKIMYIETIRTYQRKVETKILARWNKPRKEITVTFKPLAAELITDFIYTGCHYYNDHVKNLARILQRNYQSHSTDANLYLTNLQKQLS